MNINKTSLDKTLAPASSVGPKAEGAVTVIPEGFTETTPVSSSEFAGLPNLSAGAAPMVPDEPVPAVTTVAPFWIVDADGDYVRKGSIVAVRVDRHDGRYKVVGVTERMVFTFATVRSVATANEFREALARRISD